MREEAAVERSGPILIVEDSSTQAEQLRHLLQQAYPDAQILVAANGHEALDYCRAERPCLVISDVVMPVMDGYTMCAAIKADLRFKDVPVILLTSLSDPADIIRGLNAGTDYYLTKPFEEDFFLSKIATILENPSGPHADGEAGWKVRFAGRDHMVRADLQQMLNLLLSTYENAVQKNKKLLALQDELREANESLEERVQLRTQELSSANERLLVEVHERTVAEERLSRQLRQRESLRQVDAAIASSFDLRLTLNVLLDQITSQMHLDAAAVLLLQPGSSRLEFAFGRGFRTQPRRLEGHAFSLGPAGRALRTRQPIQLQSIPAEQEAPLPPPVLAEEGFVAYVAHPLLVKGSVVGILEIYHRSLLPDDEERDAFLLALAGQAAIAVDSAHLFDALQRSNIELLDAYETTLEGWSKALDLRDKETEGHSLRVMQMAEALARQMGVPASDMVHIRRGALLHDIGKLGVPDAILRKPGPLDDEELKAMRMHPQYAYEWLSSIAFLRPAMDIPYSHHEKWDGTGYPQGLKDTQIPLAARIFAVADVWDALRSERPYHRAKSQQQCLDHIIAARGSHFDPAVVDALIALRAERGNEIDDLPDEWCDAAQA
ncbi:MAG: response regulator [Candidatus Competibacteraceae bacterium]|nr:response regulator [Candidatus Competibacteraceae bacterium]